MKAYHILIFFILLSILSSCATSMSPLQVNETLPKMTKATYLSNAEAEEAIRSNRCTIVVKNRTYVAPIGAMPIDDLRNGARGIDEWIILDAANAYVLKNFKWVTVDQNGSTQLHLEFDTLKCN